MRKNRLASFSIAAATTLLTLGGAGCGEFKDIADEILSHGGGSSTGSGGTSGSPGCDYEGKTYPFGSSFPSKDGCNSCTCDQKGVACTAKGCSQPPPVQQSCEKVPVTAAGGACLAFDAWKIQSTDTCAERGETVTSVTFGSPCEDGASTREAILVCCKATPANDVVCKPSVDAATGASCTVCTDATGAVVKTDCNSGK